MQLYVRTFIFLASNSREPKGDCLYNRYNLSRIHIDFSIPAVSQGDFLCVFFLFLYVLLASVDF